MKVVKYLILSLFTMVVLITSTELFRAYCLSDEAYDHFYIRDLTDVSDYDRIRNICDTLRKNGLQFVLENRSGSSGNAMSVSYLCSSSEALQHMKERFHAEGTYKGPFYGLVTILYAEDIPSLMQSEFFSENVTVYILNPPEDYSELPFGGEYLKSEINHAEEGGQIFLYAIAAMFVLLSLLLLLLTLFEVFLTKKSTALQVLNGEHVRTIISHTLIREYLGIALAFGVPFLLLYQYCHNLPFLSKLWIALGIVMILDSTILTSAVLRLSIRETLGNATKTSGILTLCHFVQVLCTILFLIMGTLFVRMLSQYRELKNYDSAFERYKDYYYLSGVYELPERAEISELAKSFLICEHFATFASSTGYQHTVFYANHNAWASISEMVGRYDAPTDETVCFIPDNIYQEYTGQSENWGDAKQFVPYPSGACLRIAEFNIETATGIPLNDSVSADYYCDPIIVYFPKDDEIVQRANNLCFIRKNADTIRGGERTDLYQLYLGSVSSRKFYAILFGGITVILGVSLVFLSSLSLRLHHSVNAVELCLQKISGSSMLSRYQDVVFLQVLSFALGTAGAVLLSRTLAVPLIGPIIFGSCSLLAILLLLVLMIWSWERENMVKVLKGGAI